MKRAASGSPFLFSSIPSIPSFGIEAKSTVITGHRLREDQAVASEKPPESG